MKKIVQLMTTFFLLFSLSACSSNADKISDEVNRIVSNIRNDQDHTFMKTLASTLEDCQQISKYDSVAGKVYEYSQNKFTSIDNVPEDAMKPKTEDVQLIILKATATELKNGTTNGLPEEYVTFSQQLGENVIVYGIS